VILGRPTIPTSYEGIEEKAEEGKELRKMFDLSELVFSE
jgi:hypothetical protein